MRLAIAANTLRGAGSSLVGQQVVSHLVQDNLGDEFVAWVPREWGPSKAWLGEPQRLSSIALRLGRHGIGGKLRDETLGIPSTCRRLKMGALFSMGDTGCPRPGLPHLLLVQQAFLVAPPEELDFRMPMAFKAKMSGMAAYFGAGLPGVSRVTVQTTFMARWLARRWDMDPVSISVVPSAPGPEMAGRRCAPVRDPFPYVVYLASAGPHKNHSLVPAIMRELQKGGTRVRCVLTVSAQEVPAVAQEVERSGLSDLVEFRGAVSRTQAAQLLEGAIAHLVPSRLESFGLGVMEAMTVGCPVIAADREYAREMCGKAGLYAGADDAEAFAEHIASLVMSEPFWNDYSQATLQRAKDIGCSWQEIAARYRTQLAEIAR